VRAADRAVAAVDLARSFWCQSVLESDCVLDQAAVAVGVVRLGHVVVVRSVNVRSCRVQRSYIVEQSS